MLAAAGASLAHCGGRAPDASRDVPVRTQPRGEGAKAKARADAEAALEAERLATLWTYSEVQAGRGKQVAASIKSTADVDTGGQMPASVLLVFRDHPSWGRTSYLVLSGGDFKCSPRCTVSVALDDAAPVRMAAHRPSTNEAIALIVDDARALWRAATAAKRISIEFPVKAGGKRTASYEVGGLDRSKMPGWDDGPANTGGRRN
jgi:hypothetical protein